MYVYVQQEIVPMMLPEEFTFPVINTTTNQAILPPLWRISSVKNWDDRESSDESGRRRMIFRRSFSEVEEEINRKNEEETRADEEKMDLLWEDLNESNDSSSIGTDFDQSVNDCVGEFGDLEVCGNNVETGKQSSKKKKNLVVVVKMLKKLFLVQRDSNMARTKNRVSY